MRFEECPSNHSNTALVLAPAGLLPATSCHTALLWDILKSPPLWGCQPLTWSPVTPVQARRGSGKRCRHSHGPVWQADEKALGLPERAVAKPR